MGKTLDFIFNLDVFMSNGFTGKISAAEQALSSLQQKTQALQRTSGKMDAFQAQQRAIAGSSEKLSVLHERLASVQASAQTSRQATQLLNVQYQQARSRLDELSRRYPKNSQVVREAVQQVQSLRKAYQQNEAASKKLTSEGSRLEQQVKRAEESLSGEREKLRALKSELREAGINTQELSKHQREYAAMIDRAQQAQQRYNSVRSQLNWGNMRADIMQSTAVVKAFQKPIQIDMEFEQAMANVRAVSNPTSEQFTALRNQALEMGSATQFTSTQSAQAQEVLMRAGLNAEEVLNVLPNILQTAGAEGMEISQAADILINVTKNMNLPIEELGRVADVMAYTSAHSNTNIAQLGEAALKAAGPFSSMGGTVEELMSTLGAMSNTVRGGEAGTALAGVARRLGKNPKAVAKELSRYGIKTQDRQGNFAPFAEIIAQVERQAGKLGTKTAAALRGNVYGMFGSQMQGFGRTLQNGEYKTLLTGTQTESTGASAQMNRTRNNTLQGDITSLDSAWEGLMIRIGAALDPINRFITSTLTTGIQKLNKWIDQHKDWVDLIVQAGYVLGGMMIVRQVWKYADLAYQAFKAWREVKAATSAIDGVTGALEGASKGASLFGTNLLSAFGTISLIAGACYLIYTYWDDITAAAERAGQAISNIPRDVPVSQLQAGSAEKAVRVMEMGYMPPEIRNAEGGIYTRPIWTWAAEEGAEAIIPLTDKSRGIPLLQQAAEILGVPQESPSLITNTSSNTQNTSTFNPTINITVNSQGQDEQSLASLIASKVEEILASMNNLEERVSYA